MGVKIDTGEWVVVCDGAKALVLENAGDAQHLNLKTREVYEQKTRRPASRALTRRAGPSVRSARREARWGKPIGTNAVRRRSLKSW